MQKRSQTKSSSQRKFARHEMETSMVGDGMALAQMYQQSRFEAQCWFYTSLAVAIIGTVFILGTILLFLFFNQSALVAKSGKFALTIANIITGAAQHLIIAQTRAANKRADHYASELRREANELNIYEVLRVISTALPEGEERNNLIVHTITKTLINPTSEVLLPYSIPGFPQGKFVSK